MKEWQRLIILVQTAVALIVIWFCPNIVRWQLGVPYQPSDFALVVWTRFCVVMILVAIVSELRWRTPFPLKDGPFWKRVLLLAILGGTVAGELIASHFPEPRLWSWVVMPFVMALFGGVQMALVGTIATASFLRSASAPST